MRLLNAQTIQAHMCFAIIALRMAQLVKRKGRTKAVGKPLRNGTVGKILWLKSIYKRSVNGLRICLVFGMSVWNAFNVEICNTIPSRR